MNRKIKLLLIVVAVMPCVLLAGRLKPEVERAMAYGAEAKICLKVHDDLEQPVSNASVAVVFDMMPRPHSVYGKTDTNGVFVVTGKTNGNKVRFLVGKDGYYGSEKEFSYVPMNAEHDVKDGKWQPYGARQDILLKTIRNPIPMSSELVRRTSETTAINVWIGYDLNIHDFVSPYGKGVESDLEMFFDWDGKCASEYTGMGLKIRFVEPFSGYCQFEADETSDFKGPYEASASASFQQSAEFFERVIAKDVIGGRRYDRRSFDGSKCWIVRSRCKVDNEGKLVSAHYSIVHNVEYGYVKKGLVAFGFLGAFNPTPNDTNLEDEEFAKQSRHFIRHCEPPGKGNLK